MHDLNIDTGAPVTSWLQGTCTTPPLEGYASCTYKCRENFFMINTCVAFIKLQK